MVTELPRLGLGTWKNTDPEQCAASVRTALDLGYRHIDTAQLYENEAAVGRGIRATDVDREEVFLATKVSTRNLAYEDVLSSTEESLDRLGVGYLDLLYVHWPLRTYEPEDTLAAFDELHDDGVIEHVGLSNFEPDLLAEAPSHLDAPIFAHQVEMHPLCPQSELHEIAIEEDHWLVAYSPLARGDALTHRTVRSVAEEAGITPAQVCLAWLLAKERVVPIPKATGAPHIEENWEARNVALTSEQIDRIDGIERHERQVDFERAPWNR